MGNSEEKIKELDFRLTGVEHRLNEVLDMNMMRIAVRLTRIEENLEKIVALQKMQEQKRAR